MTEHDDTFTIDKDGNMDITLEAPAKVNKYKPCLCGLIRIDFPAATVAIEDLPKKHREYATLNTEGYEDGGWLHLETGCEVMTLRLFAPGHDARFKSLLQTAHRMGGEVAFGGASSSPEHFAQLNTPNLVEAITRDVAPRHATRKRKVGVETRNQRVVAKVGRWEYEGQIVLVGAGKDRTEHFHYTTPGGENKVSSTFTIIKEIIE